MDIEVRVELRSRHWKEILQLWALEGAEEKLNGVLGSVVGVFREVSPGLERLRRLYEQHREALDIRYEERRRAVYDPGELRNYELHVLLCDTVFGAVPLKSNYTDSDKCGSCGRKKVRIRLGPMILQGNEYRRYQVFTTELHEVVLGSTAREFVLQEGLTGFRFESCEDPSGRPISDYQLLRPSGRLGKMLDVDGNPLYCKECLQRQPESRPGFPPWRSYSRSEWDGSDIVSSADNPPDVCATPKAVEALCFVEPTLSLERCLPIHLR